MLFRSAALSGGELAFNEVDTTLYYGSNAGVIAIGGDGAFVNRTSAQSVSGVKTFEDGIILPNSPVNSTDGANKGYVDTEIDSLSAAMQTDINNLESNTNTAISSLSAELKGDIGTLETNLTTTIVAVSSDLQTQINNLNTSSTTAVDSLSTEVYNTFVKLTDDRAVTLTGGLDVTGNLDSDTINTTGNVGVGGSLTVTGDLTVLGAFSQLETTTTVTSAFSVVNSGSQTALTVEQTGSFDIAEFIDDGATALIIKDGGNVGIGTAAPNEKLTVSGNISASGTIYAGAGLEVANNGGISTLYVENGKVGDRKSTRLNSSHVSESRMPSSA